MKKVKMKRVNLFVFTAFFLISGVLFFYREDISLQPWLTEQSLEWTGSSSGNGNAKAIISDGSSTITVINNEGELLYRVRSGMNKNRSFVSALLAELDEKNNLYVYDGIFEGVNKEITERILKYSPKGKFLGVIYSHSYQNKDFIISKGKISGMAVQGDTLCLVRLEHDGFYLESVNTKHHGEPQIIASYPYPDAFRGLFYCRISIKGQRIVWTTKDGTILEYSFSGPLLTEIITDDNTTPYMAVSDDNYNLIYTDIWNQKIGIIDGITGEVSILYSSPVSDGNLYCYISNNNNTTYASYSADDILVINSDGSQTKINSYSFSSKQIIIRKILFSLCVAGIILLSILFIQLIVFISKKRKSAVFKQIIIFGLCIILGASISSLIILREMQKKNTESIFKELENISRIIAAAIDTSIVEDMHSPRQFNDEEYLSFTKSVSSLFSELQFEGQQVYLYIFKEHDGGVYSIFDSEYATGAFYPWGGYEDSITEQIFTSKQYFRFTDYQPSGTWEMVLGPIFDKDGNVIAAIETGVNIRTVEEENRTMLIQTALIVLATTVAFLLLVIECLLLFDAHRKNKLEVNGTDKIRLEPNLARWAITLLQKAYMPKESEGKIKEVPSNVPGTVINNLVDTYKYTTSSNFHPELLRAAAFFMYFSANFAAALLPVYAAQLYVPVYNFPREFIITLPFTAMAIFIIITLLLIPNILGKTGTRKISLIAAILFVAGNITCFMAKDVIYLSAGYALIGLSCGTFGLIFNTIIGSQKNVAAMNKGFAHLNASYLAGVNVGVVFGAIIAQFFPYRILFLFSSVIALLFFGIILFSLRSILFRQFYDLQHIKEKNTEKFSLVKFIFKPVVLCILIMALVPYIISVNFVEYFTPIFGMENGLGEANIGQLILLSGLFAILFGASLCQFVAKKTPMFISVIFPLVLNAAALFLFSFNVSISMLIVTIVLLAIVNIFASTNIQTYFTLLYQTSGVSSAKALGAYSVMENLAMAAGPIVFSYILAVNIATGMRLLAGFIIIGVIVFTIISKFSVSWNNDTICKITE